MSGLRRTRAAFAGLRSRFAMPNAGRTGIREVLDPAQMQPVLDVAAKYHAIPQTITAKELIARG